MRILSVDTSSDRGSICVVDAGEIVGEIRLSSSLQHSERLFGAIELLFKSLSFRLDDVDRFVAARGPGSFTGLRVGLAASEGFAAAFGREGVGISTLDGLAWNAGPVDGWIAPTIDARRGEVYGGLYRRTGDELIEARSPAVLQPAEWFESLPEEPVALCGDGILKYGDLVPNRPMWQRPNVNLYLASGMAELSMTSRRGPLAPLYVRKAEAEIVRERLHESIAGPNT